MWNINVRKQAIGDKLQGSVATYLRFDGVVNNQIKKSLLLSMAVIFFFKSVHKQEHGCIMHFVRLATTMQKKKKVLETTTFRLQLCQIFTDLKQISLIDLTINVA